MSATDPALPQAAVEQEAERCADAVWNAQAVMRTCMSVIDPDTGPDELDNSERHTIWRALKLADGILQTAAEATAEIGKPD